MGPRFAVILMMWLASAVQAQQPVTFHASDGALISADLYAPKDSKAPRAVILAHGGRFTKESWKPQAEQLCAAGFRVLAIDFRGFGKSAGPGTDDVLAAPLYLDLLAAASYLRSQGAASISIVGGSAHAQALFETDQADKVFEAILHFMKAE